MLVLHDGNPLVHIRRAWVNQTIVVLILLVFLAQTFDLFFWPRFAFFPLQLIHGLDEPGPLQGIVGLVTHIFLHGSWLHLLGNLIALWVFGDNIEDAMGHFRYLLFFFVCGIAAALAQAFLGDPRIPMIGASGAVSAVMGAYLLLHPRARVLMLAFNVVPILAPAALVVGADIMLNAYMAWEAAHSIRGLANSEAAGIAWWAHIGGFVAGMALIAVLRRRDVALFQPAPAAAGRTLSWVARFIPTLAWRGERPVGDEADAPAKFRNDRWMVFVKALIYVVLIFVLTRVL
ncbi:MAG: rhomboid family intramembrane serine protease [Dongiaceae bacterium]